MKKQKRNNMLFATALICTATFLTFGVFGVLGKYSLEASIDGTDFNIGDTVTMSGVVEEDGEGFPEAQVTITDDCGREWVISDGGATNSEGQFSATTTAGSVAGYCDVHVEASYSAPHEFDLQEDLGYNVLPHIPIKTPNR